MQRLSNGVFAIIGAVARSLRLEGNVHFAATCVLENKKAPEIALERFAKTACKVTVSFGLIEIVSRAPCPPGGNQ